MVLTLETHEDHERTVAAYVQLRDGEVVRTVQIEEDVCYADEDVDGHLLGFEVLGSGHLTEMARRVAMHYGDTEMDRLLEQAKAAIA